MADYNDADQSQDVDGIDWTRQEEQDDALMNDLLDSTRDNINASILDSNRPFDQADKADDAEDYEDISDDDLPEEEGNHGTNGAEGPGLTDDGGTSHDTDDLFGEDGRASSPLEAVNSGEAVKIRDAEHESQEQNSFDDQPPAWKAVDYDGASKTTNQDLSIPAPAESADDLVKQLWPSFKQGVILDWNSLLPPRVQPSDLDTVLKRPLKEPKQLNLTKVTLEVAHDQEKSFKTATQVTLTKKQRMADAAAKGLVAIELDSSCELSSEDDFDWTVPAPDSKLGGVAWADLEMLCDDWDAKIDRELSDSDNDTGNKRVLSELEQEDEEWLREFAAPVTKKQNVQHTDINALIRPKFAVPSFDDFERLTARIAKRPYLDPNDPHLLLDYVEQQPSAKRTRVSGSFKRARGKGLSKSLSKRFNISNDEAYDALKENHQSKVRAVVGNFTLEHALAAIKLQWPYFRVKLYTREARSYHRPAIKFNRFVNHSILFTKPTIRKRKHLKGLKTDQIFAQCKDLSLGDNSTAMLLEYSEEYPTVLSNFGMNARIMNYYRRKNAEDTTRPKLEVGETHVLLPEDKSPFAKFGFVEPGETTPTMYTGMYQAPVFKHDAKNTDFLVVRSSSGVSGSSWFIRNIDHLYAVGQQFPSVEIPKPSSRKVTTASKNRMKMIAFRKIAHSVDQSVKIGDITEHIADSTDMQNRQKLKEFIQYSKEDKLWKMRAGEVVPDELTIRAMVKPEDVCVIDAMQVGARHLEDAGYGKIDDDDGDEADDDEGESLEQKLAPWKTSKNFLEAAQGKAMLQLHGDGDPSGCGLAFSFIKTSMKGGYLNAKQGPLATSADAIARERKANGGHLYNVDKQNALYNQAIHDIWNAQKANLSDPNVREESTVEQDAEIEDEFGIAPTPRDIETPANFDDSASQMSRFSSASRREKQMRITRKVKNKLGKIEEVIEVVLDQRVWREYQKRRNAIDAESMNVYEAAPTGDADFDKKEALRIKKELLRLERNKERRHAREKQKGILRRSMETDGASPGATPAPAEKASGTTRKCANCGQAGHIKTNKKLCPLLNGTMKVEANVTDHNFGAIAAPSFASSSAF